MREFVLTGSYYEMGRQYGHYCRKEIKIFTKTIQIMTTLSEHPDADFFSPNYRYLPSALTLASKFLWLNIDPIVKNRMPMLLYLSILNRCATVDEAQDLLESLPNCGVGTAVYVGDAEKFLRMETSIMDREIEVVKHGVRWNANAPRTKTMAPYSKIDEMEEAATYYSKNRKKRLEYLDRKYSGKFDTEAMHTIISDHGHPNDETHMHSMCMHPKHTNGAQTMASIIAMPRQRMFRVYETNPCLNKMKLYEF